MSRLKNILLVYISLFISVSGIFALETDSVLIQRYESILNELFGNISNNSDDLKKKEINKEIIENIEQVLTINGSFNYSFDTLKNLGKTTSPDRKIRIYTWNLPYSNGLHKYFGFIQYKPASEDNYRLFELTDKSDILELPETLILTDTSWYGALYYQIIEKEYMGNNYYTLLGFDLNSMMTNKKIIELLYFNDDNLPVFGKPVFNYHNEMKSRIIFEYSTKAVMGLKYNNELDMIVFDHLSPAKPSYEGRFMFYGPDFSYDGLKFENGIWNEIKDVDVRNITY